MVDDLPKYLALSDQVQHGLQLGFEDPGSDVRAVKAVLSRLHRKKDFLPEGVCSEGEENGGLAKGADNGQCILGLLDIPAWRPHDGCRQNDDLAGVVKIIVRGCVQQALIALRLEFS